MPETPRSAYDDAKHDAWQRSKRLQRELREQGKSVYHVHAQAEYDYCKAVSETPRNERGPTAKEWFRDEDVPVSDAGTVPPPERAVDLHVVRPADSPNVWTVGPAAVSPEFRHLEGNPRVHVNERGVSIEAAIDRVIAKSRWDAIAKDRGGSYWQQVQPHLWAIAYVALGVIIGAFSVKTGCP